MRRLSALRSLFQAALTVLFGLAAVACNVDAPGEDGPRAGVPQEITLGAPVVTLGRWDVEDEAQVMHEPLRAAVIGDTLVAVLDGESREIRAFDLGGRLVWSAGGPGGGPGEFEHAPWHLQRLGLDRLVAVDAPAQRVNVYTIGGDVDDAIGLDSADGLPSVFGVLEGSPPEVAFGVEVRAEAGAPGPSRVILLAQPLSEGPADTIGIFPGPVWEEVQLDHGMALRARSGSGEVRVTAAHDVVVTAGTDDSVRVMNRDGLVERTFSLPGAPSGDRWSGNDVRDIELDDHGRLWLSRDVRPGESLRRWVVMDIRTGQQTPELALRGSLRGIGQRLVVVARVGEMEEIVFHVLELSPEILALPGWSG